MAKDKATMSMGTEDVAREIALLSKGTENELSIKAAQATLNLLKQVVCDGLKAGKKVQLTGFVAFVPSYRAARTGNNVLTNKPIDIPESVVVSAKIGKPIKTIMKDITPGVMDYLKNAAE